MCRFSMLPSTIIALLVLASSACRRSDATRPPRTPAPEPTQLTRTPAATPASAPTNTAAAPLSPPASLAALSLAIGENAVAAVTGVEKLETSPDGVVNASFPRKDVDVAIHHHMTGETPRGLFLHHCGKGKASHLAAAVRKALDLTAVEKST